ncbi:MAG TPA: membrane dipeptidase [Ramlibacter sp.]|uniref:dipeptidase n=1 Tax=Ramlibacter sp. TaxID=1917967 RepID=UPI002CBECF55|nr:membrane dipeptidase [Ramlibacter sp.]HVZ45942.1 membrane dipeptidase [Ramlibacter sp.]
MTEAHVENVDEAAVAAICGEAPFINASDLTAITRGMPYRPQFNAEYIGKLREGGVTAIHSSLVVWFWDSMTPAVKRLSSTLRFLDEHANDLVLVRTAADIDRARSDGKIGLIVHFHNSSALEDDISMVATFHRLGLRVMQLTYQGRSLLGDGCAEPSPGGLSAFGIKVVEEMNRVGILVDLAHAGERTFMEALEVSTQPVVCSHGGVNGVRAHSRNLSDEQLRALAKKGGVLGIMAKADTLVEGGATRGATFEDYFAHLDYAVKLVGPDHVAIGLENGWGVDNGQLQDMLVDVILHTDKPFVRGRIPRDYEFDKYYSAQGVNDTSTVKANLVREMLRRGYARADMEKILAGNLMRVYAQVWKP